MRNFKNLEIWIKSRKLVFSVYQLTTKFPKDEKFGLTQQIKRAVISVPSNIAEGCGRESIKELIHFLNIAIGSLCEVETQIYLCEDLNFINQIESNDISTKITEIRKMIFGYIRYIKNLSSNS